MSSPLFESEDIKELEKGIVSFNKGDFWQCHEDLEDWWIEHQFEPRVNFVWAIIQVATAIFHAQRNNIKGAQSQLAKAKKKISKVHSFRIADAQTEKLFHWSDFCEKVESLGENASISDIMNLSRFKFEGFFEAK